MPDGKLSISEFAANIKSKYPQYKDVNDTLLTQKIIEKYPEYKERVDYDVNSTVNYPSPSLSTANGIIHERPTQQPLTEREHTLQMLGAKSGNTTDEDGVTTIRDNSQTKSNLPDIGEAIDNAIAQKKAKYGGNIGDEKFHKDAIAAAYKNGDLVLAKDNQGKSVLKKPAGFIQSFTDALNQAAIDRADNENLSNLDTQGKIDYLKAKSLDKGSETAPGNQEFGIGLGPIGEGLNKVSQFLGQNADLLQKGTLGAMSGGATGLAGAANLGSFLAIANDMGKDGYAHQLEKTYGELKQQNPSMPDMEAMDKAHQSALVGEATGLATGAFLSATPASGGLLKAITKYEIPKMGAVGAGEALVNNAGELSVGVKKKPEDILNEVGESAATNAAVGAAFWILQHPTKIASYLRPQAENVVASLPKETRQAFVNTAEQSGAAPQGFGENVESKVKDFEAAKKPLEKLPIPEENKAAIAGKILQKQQLEQERSQLQKHGEAFAPRIEELNNQIAGIEKEMGEMYKAKDVFTKEQDNLTGEKPSDNETIPAQPEKAETDNQAQENNLGEDQQGIDPAEQEAKQAREQKAQELGFDHPQHLINSVNAELGTEYKTVEEMPQEDIDKTIEQRKAKRVIEAHNEIDGHISDAEKLYDDAVKEKQAYIKENGYPAGADKDYDKIVTKVRDAEDRVNKLKTAKDNLLPIPNSETKNNDDAVQEQSAGESLLRNEGVRGESGLPGVEQTNGSEETPGTRTEEAGQNKEASSPQEVKMPFDEFKTHALEMAENMKDSKFDWRFTLDMDQKTREAAVKDIREGKQTKRAEKLLNFIQGMYDKGVVSVNRGRGALSEQADIPLHEWFGTKAEHLQAANKINDEATSIINGEGLTLDNLEKVKHLFDGFPYTEEDYNNVKSYLERQAQGSEEAGPVSTGSQGEPAEITNEQPPEPERTTGIKNAVTDNERLSEGKDAIIPRKTNQNASFEETKKMVDDGEIDPRSIALALSKDPRSIPLTDTVIHALNYDRMRLGNEYREVITKLADGIKSGLDNDAELLARKSYLEDAKDANDTAAKLSGTEQSSAFRARQNMVKEDYSLLHTIQRYKVASHSTDVPKEVESKLSELTAKLEEALKKNDDYERRIKETEEKLSFEKTKRTAQREIRESRRVITKGKLLAEREKLVDDLRSIARKQRSQLSANPLPVEMIPVIAKLTKNLVMDGITTIEGVVDHIYGELKDHIDGLEKRHIRDAISAYGKTSTMSDDPIDKQIREIKRQGKLISALEDAQKGEPPARSGLQRDKPSDTVRDLQKQVAKVMKENGVEIDKKIKDPDEQWRTALQSYKTRLENKLSDLETKKSKGDFTKQQRKSLILDEEAVKLKSAVKRAQMDIDNAIKKEELKKRTWLQKSVDFLVQLKREAVITNLSSIPKLAIAGLNTVLRTPLEDIVVGGVLNKMLPKSITGKALSEGGDIKTNASASGLMFKEYAKQWKELFLDFNKSQQGKILKTGQDDIDTVMNDGNNKDEMFTLYFGRLHGLLKNPTKQALMVKTDYIIKNNMIKQSIDPTTPENLRLRADLSYLEGKRGILTNKNLATSLYRMGIYILEKAPKYGGKLAAAAMKIEMPIVTVPTNFFNEILKYNYGSVFAGAKILHVIFFKGGLDNISMEDANYIVKALKKQGVGAAVYTLGFLLRNQIGGYDDKENKKKGLKKGEVKFLGATIPSVFFHNPVLEPLLMGATTGDYVMDKDKDKNSFNAGLNGIYAGTAGAFKETPFIGSADNILRLLSGREKLNEHVGQLVASEVPSIVSEVARYYDKDKNGNPIKRKPDGFWDNIFMSVPGGRQHVKTEVEKIMEKRANPTHKTAEEKSQTRSEHIANEKAMKDLCTELGIKYLSPRR